MDSWRTSVRQTLSKKDSPDKGHDHCKVVTKGILSCVVKPFEKSPWLTLIRRYWRQNICSNSGRKWYIVEGMAVRMSQSKWIWERLQHGSNRVWQPRSTRKGQGKLDWYSCPGLDSGVNGGARLRIREYRRSGKFWGRRWPLPRCPVSRYYEPRAQEKISGDQERWIR